MEEKDKTPSLEEGFLRLEEVIERMEQDELPLEEAFRSYSEGMELLKQCNEQIDRVEKQVLKLNGAGGLEEFTDGQQ